MHLAQDALKLQTFVKAVLNLRVRVNVETILPTVNITIFLSVTVLLIGILKTRLKPLLR